MKLLDTWAWVEYFKGTKKGLKVKDLIKESQVYTSAISLAEITKWFYENNGDIYKAIKQVKENSIIIQLEEDILIESGKIYVKLRKIKNKIGLIDTIIYVTGILHDLDIVTGDKDFEGLVRVEFMQ